MRLFLDTSVILAACGSANGASRFVVNFAQQYDWTLRVSAYVIRETEKNIVHLSADAPLYWQTLQQRIETVADIHTFPWVNIFERTKDRPVLFTAVFWADVLLTLDQADFGQLMGNQFYGLSILKPAQFLQRQNIRPN